MSDNNHRGIGKTTGHRRRKTPEALAKKFFWGVLGAALFPGGVLSVGIPQIDIRFARITEEILSCGIGLFPPVIGVEILRLSGDMAVAVPGRGA